MEQEEITLLLAAEKIIYNFKNEQINKEFLVQVRPYLECIATKMEITHRQALFLSLILSQGRKIDMNDMAEVLKCSHIRFLQYTNDLDELEHRGLIRVYEDCESKSYNVPWEVIEAFKRNEKFIERDYSGLTCYELFNELAQIFDMREHDLLTINAANRKIDKLLECNKQLKFVQRLREYDYSRKETIIILFFCHLFVNKSDDMVHIFQLNLLFRSHDLYMLSRLFAQGEHKLQLDKIIESTNADGLANNSSFSLTLTTKKHLLVELNIKKLLRDTPDNNVINSKSITVKQLCFDPEVSAKINELGNLLSNKQYNAICKRLKQKGFRSGFTCLFYGAPGTGKTETVMQLARQTGRGVVKVNISEIRSKWVGDSEKNIKHIFNSYREQVRRSELAPILLFNEADAIIGKRSETTKHAVNRMENTIQNIILEELESLEGIFIATTNLAQNMDKAFERRFLYKVHFMPPTIEARTKIWHEMIPELSLSDCRLLAKRYPFSGGQIENIARHYSINSILYGNTDQNIGNLIKYCDGENIQTKKTTRIGFQQQ